jgi:hypothetical protein
MNFICAEGDGMRLAVSRRFAFRRGGVTGKGWPPDGIKGKLTCFRHNPKFLIAVDRAVPDLPKGKHTQGPFPLFPTLDSTATFFAQLPKRITLFQYGACPVTGQAPLLPFDSISGAGHFTCEQRGWNKAMAMPVAKAKNRFVLAQKMVYSFIPK